MIFNMNLLQIISLITLSIELSLAWQVDPSCGTATSTVTASFNEALTLAQNAVTRLGSMQVHDQQLFLHLFGTSNNLDQVKGTFNYLLGTSTLTSTAGPPIIYCAVGAPQIPQFMTECNQNLNWGAYFSNGNIVLCPRLFSQFGNGPYNLQDVISQDTSGKGLLGKFLDNFELMGPIMLHELLHYVSNQQIIDLTVVDPTGATVGCYGFAPCYYLSQARPADTVKNADSFNLLAIGFYLDKYDWSTGQAVAIGTEPNDAMDIDKRRVVRNRYRRNVVYV